ncbi:uncharacterized protein BDR25DRAFT_332587 [Lindgomyces ingoldianus]|uniref:Uncharacterized protein n=1 Tax=Lindgomyces ingoldianus TaxID=673940 RepID=A0ACB6R5K1_9PLEO|nr:uncharacterized protein BDR25DRAFT_332587 [Lindgomyces ingoldianus]KAF2473802.1 hypothetical protein BDR25DRAFT_332587 [Lindgomyces ingoldianus]
MANGPPYLPMTWGIGGIPRKNIDVPITSVFLFLYILAAVTHMALFRLNQRRGHKFLISIFLFGFCMARVVTCVMRIASTCVPHNISLAIAASIFVAAGVLIVFIVNLIFAQRILRSTHPHFGWHPALSILFKALYVLIGLTFAIVITATVQSFYTIRPRTRTIDRDLQLYAATLLTTISFLPIPIVLISLLIPRKSPPENFGTGRFRTKVLVLLTSTLIICLGAAFRCGTAWKKPVLRTKPLPTYYSRTCFYIFNFAVEIVVIYLYAIMRVDLRFWIPGGAKGPGGYEAGQGTRGQSYGADEEEKGGGMRKGKFKFASI